MSPRCTHQMPSSTLRWRVPCCPSSAAWRPLACTADHCQDRSDQQSSCADPPAVCSLRTLEAGCQTLCCQTCMQQQSCQYIDPLEALLAPLWLCAGAQAARPQPPPATQQCAIPPLQYHARVDINTVHTNDAILRALAAPQPAPAASKHLSAAVHVAQQLCSPSLPG